MKRSVIECDAILFDLDGVLIDSTSCIVRHWQEWADRQGVDINLVLQNAHGLRTIETIRLVAPHLDAEKEAEQFTAHEVADTEGVVAIEGANLILANIPEGRWGLVTSGGLDLVRARLREAGLPVPKILVTGDDVVNGKPDAEPYLTGMKRLGVAAERCLVIEDAPAGVTAGKKAGMRVVGIAATHSRAELMDWGADWVIGRLIDLEIEENERGDGLLIRVW